MRTDQMPIGVTWRPATPDDTDAIVDLQDACFEVDGGYREVADEIGDRFESPMLDIDSDTLVGVDASGRLIVSIWNYIVPEPVSSWQVYDDTYVHPDVRSAAMSDAVLGWWMDRARARVREADTNLPIEFHQHIYPESQRDEAKFIEGRGFAPNMYFDEMRRDLLVAIPVAVIPDGLVLAPFDEVAPAATLAARNDAFRDHRGSQPWTLEMWEKRSAQSGAAPYASFAVLDGDRPVSYVLGGVYPHDWEDRGYSEGWIEGVGTIRGYRGRGLASAVITVAMRAYADKGMQYATLEVDSENPTGAAGLYADLGFERVRGYIDYTLTVEPHA